MKWAVWIVVAIVAALSIAAGGAKVASMPQEVQFFADAGVSGSLLVPMGVVQVVAGLAVIPPSSRKVGGILAAIVFLLSAAMIASTGNIGFALVSLVPAALAGFVAWRASPVSAQTGQ